MDYEPTARAVRPKRPLAAALILALIAFALGLAAMGWLLAHWNGGARFLGVVPAAPAAQPAPAPAAVT
ncbi:MAG: hypothetical protein JWO81_1598, partial [Alphaproteobacteria bacterium]|nr:hypothetical protein [Alphaproteobacteria bacterium]